MRHAQQGSLGQASRATARHALVGLTAHCDNVPGTGPANAGGEEGGGERKKKKRKKKTPATAASGAVSLGLVNINNGRANDTYTTRMVALSGRTSSDGGKQFVQALEPGIKLRSDTFVEMRSRYAVDPRNVLGVLEEMQHAHVILSVDVLLLDFHGKDGGLLGCDNQGVVCDIGPMIGELEHRGVRVAILALCDGERTAFPKHMNLDVIYFYGAVPVIAKTRICITMISAAAALPKEGVTGEAMYNSLSYQDKRFAGLRRGRR